MIVDTTGTILIPGNLGKDCPGNGQHCDDSGIPIECCYDEGSVKNTMEYPFSILFFQRDFS